MARTPIHPGEILSDELEEIGLSAKKLADVIQVPPNRLYQLLAGKRNITADTALRLGQYFGMSADFWMNLQSSFELDLARKQHGKEIQRIPKRGQTAETRGILNSRYDDLKSGRVKPVPGEEFMARLRERSATRRSAPN
jgi:antitoxin HigA-1